MSAPSVTLGSLQIGFVLVNERESWKAKRHTSRRKGEKTALLWLMSGSPRVTRTVFVPSNSTFDPGWACFFFLLSLVFLFSEVFFTFFFLLLFLLLVETVPKC